MRQTLYGLGHDHGPSVEAYRALLDEAEQIRGELVVLAGFAERLRSRPTCEARRHRPRRRDVAPSPRRRRAPPSGSATRWRTLRANLDLRSDVFRHAVRLALCVAGSDLAGSDLAGRLAGVSRG